MALFLVFVIVFEVGIYNGNHNDNVMIIIEIVIVILTIVAVMVVTIIIIIIIIAIMTVMIIRIVTVSVRSNCINYFPYFSFCQKILFYPLFVSINVLKEFGRLFQISDTKRESAFCL